MNEREVMTMLSDANPVRVEDLADSAMPGSIFGRRRSRPPIRRLATAAAAMSTALAASLIGVFAFGGHSSGVRSHPSGPGGGAPLGHIPLVDASGRLGATVVLPNTALVSPQDADDTVETACPPKDDTMESACQIVVSFPEQGLTVTYVRPGEPDPKASFEQTVQQDPSARLVSLNGVPALFVQQEQSWIEFETGGTEITVKGSYSEAQLRSVAQSIVDRSSSSSSRPAIFAEPLDSATPVADAAAANALLPFKVALPAGAIPTSMGVYEKSHQLSAYFDTEASGPYTLVEGPTTETVEALKETARMWTVGPIHEIDMVDGVDVLLQGDSDGSLTASWIRQVGGSSILTWIQGPETERRGQIDGTFTKQQALAVAGDIIRQEG
jgi:hypothetical protein